MNFIRHFFARILRDEQNALWLLARAVYSISINYGSFHWWAVLAG